MTGIDGPVFSFLLSRHWYTDTVVRRASAATPAWLDPADAELARRQAVSHGMEYESYLRMIVHRALEEERKRA